MPEVEMAKCIQKISPYNKEQSSRNLTKFPNLAQQKALMTKIGQSLRDYSDFQKSPKPVNSFATTQLSMAWSYAPSTPSCPVLSSCQLTSDDQTIDLATSHVPQSLCMELFGW